jgi:heme/copper-type cytochrome/quinol oxidase subunit 1
MKPNHSNMGMSLLFHGMSVFLRANLTGLINPSVPKDLNNF